MLELFRSKRRAAIWLTETLIIVSMLTVAARLRLGQDDLWDHAPALVAKWLLAAVVVQASLYYFGLYADEAARSPGGLFVKTFQGTLVGAVVLSLLYYAFPPLDLGRAILVAGLVLASLVLPVWRLGYLLVTRSPTFLRRVVVVGDGPLARDIEQLLVTRPLGLSLFGLLRHPNEPGPFARGVVGTYDDLVSLVARNGIDLVLVAYHERRGTLPVDQLLGLKFNGVQIQEGVDFYEEITGKIYVREIKPSQLIFAQGFEGKRATRRAKRIFDVVVSAVALVLTGPVFALAALAIRLESRGPVLYRQVRSGEFGREFSMLKFRSMRLDAEKDGARWASEDDDRVTGVGRVLRKTRIDELPQLWNVLRGDMSLVGPRPERPVFVAELERQVPFFRQRLYVKPGVTGHAQVRCRYAASVEDSLEKLQYDLYYIKSFSMLFDLSILLDTVKVMALKIGSR